MTTYTFPLTGPISVSGRIGHGSFHVIAQDGLTEATATVTARSAQSDTLERTVIELNGSTLSITSPRQGGIFEFLGKSRDPIDIEVTVPTGTEVNVTTFSAAITLDGRCGTADLATGAAPIVVDQIEGTLRLRYGGGTCRVGQVSGSVQLRSGSGSATFGEIGGALSAACGSGELSASIVRGSVRSRAGSGAAAIGAAFGDVDIASGSGELSIGLPAGVPARLDVTTGSGRVNSELPISDVPLHKSKPITVRARTGSGDVRLFRAATAA
jgi:hypothetical protein